MRATRTDREVKRGAYGRSFSFFSHRLFIAYQPGELHDYLARLFEDPGVRAGAQPAAANPDAELARWILLHRSELNPLRLNRLIEGWRAPNDELRVPETDGARSASYRIDITMQFMIELELAEAPHGSWLQDRQHLYQARLDAAYYVARRRPVRDDVDVKLDLSDDNKVEFHEYLRSRMNLEEHQSRSDDAAADADPFRADEVAWLYGLARGIAQSLASQGDSSLMKLRWLNAVAGEARRQYGQVPPPTEAVYSSLLCGKESVLLVTDADEHRYQWRYLSIGKTSVRTTITEAVQSCAAARDLIDQLEATLRDLLQGGQATPLHPLKALAEQYGVLPTTPPWSAVDRARAQLQVADAGGGSLAQATDAAAELTRYATLLRTEAVANGSTLALLLAAVLAGAARADAAGADPLPPDPSALGPTPAEWDAALRGLRNGLRLDLLDSAAVLDSVGRTYGALCLLVPAAPEPPAASAAAEPMPWALSALTPSTAIAFHAGLALRRQASVVALARIVHDGWTDLQQRLATVNEAALPLASAAELLMAAHAAGAGVSSLPWLRLDQAPLRDWSTLLLKALQNAGGVDASRLPLGEAQEIDPSTPPVSLVPQLLRRLGLRGVGSGVVPPYWLSALNLPAPMAAELEDALSQFLASARGAPPRRLALVLYRGGASLSDGWPLPPQHGVVLAVTPPQLAVLLKWVDPARLAGLEMLRLAWDMGDDVDQLLESAFRALLPPLQRLPCTRELWLYGRSDTALRKTPRLVLPRRADELWVDL